MPFNILDLAEENPPRCIAGFIKAPRKGITKAVPEVFFRLSCTCDGCVSRLLGYNRASDAYPDQVVFIGPLDLECLACGKVTELMNPEKHGYNGEIGSNTTMIGTGTKSAWQCPRCESPSMECTVGFSYQIEGLDSEQHPQDMFDGFIVHAKCQNCNAITEVTSFECA